MLLLLFLITSCKAANFIKPQHAEKINNYNDIMYKLEDIRNWKLKSSVPIRRSLEDGDFNYQDDAYFKDDGMDDIEEVENYQEADDAGQEEEDVDDYTNSHSQSSTYYVDQGQANYNSNVFVSPYGDYNMYDQAYRMLGGYIDCDPNELYGMGSHDRRRNRRTASYDGNTGCTRWIIWASYVRNGSSGNNYGRSLSGGNPNNADDMDCHRRSSNWSLLGVYRQDYYQFIEQITKHLFSYDSWEYNVLLDVLDYTSTYCSVVGYTNDGGSLYADVKPVAGGDLEMGLYTDEQCIEEYGGSATYDDFGGGGDRRFKRKLNDEGGEGQNEYGGGQSVEYSLTAFNQIFDTFRQCISCIDYPTYQDGYLIGDTGTDEDDLINQCWKFHSHDSFPCEGDCLALASTQGTILPIQYGDIIFGSIGARGWLDVTEQRQAQLASRRRRNAIIYLCTSIVLLVSGFVSYSASRVNQAKLKKKTRKYRRKLLAHGIDPGESLL